MTDKNILVIEDDQEIRSVLQFALELEGYKVATAIHGQDALNQLRQTDSLPHLILLDLMMPVMDGWQFLAIKKQEPRLANLPVLVVSAAGDRAKNFEASGYIKKPIELDFLLESIKQHCVN